MSTAWQAPKTTWDATMGVAAGDLNRIEGNTQYLKGTANGDVAERLAIIAETDTRTINLTYTSDQLTSATVVDPNNVNATVETVTLTYSGGQLSTIAEALGGRTITSTLNYTGAQLNSITKVVV